MNLHDLDVPEGAFLKGHQPDIDTAPYFTPQMIQRLEREWRDPPVYRTLTNAYRENPYYVYTIQQPYVQWDFTTNTVVDNLPNRLEGVFLDLEA